MRLVVRRQRPVDQARRHEQPSSAVAPHDERVGAREGIETDAIRLRHRVRGLRRPEVGHVVADPFAARRGDAGLGVRRIDERRIPPDPPLALAPRIAARVGGGAVVHDAAVGRPGPAPLEMRPRHAGRVGLAPRREVLIPRRVAAAIDPRSARRRAVVLELAEPLQVLRGIRGHVPVDFAQHLARADLARVERHLARIRIEVPGEVVPPLVARQRGRRVRLLQPLRQVVVEPAVGAAVARRLGGVAVPLQHALRVGEAAVVLRDLGGGEEEDLGLDVGDVHLTVLHFRREVPMGGRFGEPVVLYDQPIELAQRPAGRGTVEGRRGILPHDHHALDLALGHRREAGDVGVVAQDLRVPVVAEVVRRRRGVAVHRLEVRHEELGQVAVVAGRRRLGRHIGPQRFVRTQRRGRVQVPVDAVVQRRHVGRALDGGVAAQRHDPGAGPADVAEQQL